MDARRRKQSYTTVGCLKMTFPHLQSCGSVHCVRIDHFKKRDLLWCLQSLDLFTSYTTCQDLAYISLAVWMLLDLTVDLSLLSLMLVYIWKHSYFHIITMVIIFFVSFIPQECNIKMLTNARLHKKNKPSGPKNGMIESLLWPFSILDWSQWI